jgi:hypothetical protein
MTTKNSEIRRQQRADPKQDEQGKYRRHDSAKEFHQAGANQIPHAFHVVHDAGDECAGFVGVVVNDG